ncbi:S9 family peptidase [Paraburkholderia unamae]|uniref:Dipeptidyl aminopeptidase/acylaminoacyl peptidase n=1 Tax=Paraburkholderia unamae TaxID=219649 RepID=A0ABX5KA58_9BURK|nr:S9 family peptidase [Paraburkholderia unamae]PVX61050.1 dipeptidyl aminopeptidase/acylaminoacyl peptidase [Paraburkholderia unamae]
MHASARVSRRELFAHEENRALQISPDGATLSFIRSGAGAPNVWLAALDAPHDAKPITFFSGRGVSEYRWTPDCRHLLVMKDVAGEEHTQLHAVDVATGAIRDLTADPAVKTKLLSASAGLPDTALVAFNSRDGRYFDVYRVDLLTGVRTLVLKNDARYTDFIASSSGRLRVAVRVNPEDGSSTYFDLSTSPARAFLTVPLRALRSSKVLSVTARGTLVMLYAFQSDLANVVEVDIETGAIRQLAQARTADIVDVLDEQGSGAILASREDPLVGVWEVRSPQVEIDFALLGAQAGTSFKIVSQTPDGQRWLVQIASQHRPDDYAIWSRERRQLTRLFSSRPTLEARELASTTAIEFRAADGLRITGYLTLPANTPLDHGRPRERLALVLNVHGGPWLRDEFGFNAEAQWLAAQGYAALSINFRGSCGFGNAFMEAADGAWSAAMHDDLLDAVQWAIDQGIADPQKVAIYGLSYGGYSALVGLAFTPGVFACAVDIAGPSNLVSLLGAMPAWWTFQRPQFALRMGDPASAAGEAELRERSPISRVSAITQPLLIAQGTNDPRVRVDQSATIAAALAVRKRPVTYLLYPDEGHEFEKTSTRLSFYAIAEHFLAASLGGVAEPYGSDLDTCSMSVETGIELVPGLDHALAGRQMPRTHGNNP